MPKSPADWSPSAGKIREIDSLVGGIAAASREQSQGVADVNRAVINLNETPQRNAATAEESAATGEELAVQVEALHQLTAGLFTTVHGQTEETTSIAHCAPATAPSTANNTQWTKPEPKRAFWRANAR